MKQKQLMIVALLCASFWMGCKGNDQANTSKELELREKELALKEKELQMQETKTATTTPTVTTPTVAKPATPGQAQPAATKPAATKPSGDRRISGDKVIMREGPTSESNKLGYFTNGESLSVLEKKQAGDANEVVAKGNIILNTKTGQVKVNNGAAMKIEEYYDEGVRVNYKGMSGQVSYDDIDNSNTWYKVRKSDGKTCWVLGKFVK